MSDSIDIRNNQEIISIIEDSTSGILLKTPKQQCEALSNFIERCSQKLEQVELKKISVKTRHRLCVSLVTAFFLLLEHETDDFSDVLSSIRKLLTCMSLLKQVSLSSHILCRALLDRALVYGQLFNRDFDSEASDRWVEERPVQLTTENLKKTLAHRFRRLPNHNPDRLRSRPECSNQENGSSIDIPSKESINSYLLVEAFKSSIDDIETFSNLFVEFHCQVIFDKNSWPNDESLRVINARNLSILRRFEQIPPFWDLYELIGQAGCLKSCLVLVKALLSAHLALWASGTSSSVTNKLVSSARLIPPLAQSQMIPKEFALGIEVFPHLSSSEVYSVLTDIWQYLKDSNLNASKQDEMSPRTRRRADKVYLNRLRYFMAEHMPGPLYVKIFRNLHQLDATEPQSQNQMTGDTHRADSKNAP